MNILGKKIIRTTIVSLVASRVFFLILSTLFPKTWFIFDKVRLYFQKHIITAISDINYRSKVGKTVDISKVLSQKKIIAGDLIFTSEESSLGSAFIDGKWKHVLLYLGNLQEIKRLLGKKSDLYKIIESLGFDKKEALILESTFDGVKIKKFSSLKATESFAVVRLELPKKVLANAISPLSKDIDKPYDFDFNLADSNELYCSELLYPSFLALGFSPKLTEGTLRTIITPDSLLASLFDSGVSKHLVYILFYGEEENGKLIFKKKSELKATVLHI